MIRQIPNLLTSLNLVCGAAGIINLFQGDYTNTIFFILLCGVFDFFDGFAARLLKVSGPFGKELDSLADMVSFGLLPALYLYQLSEGLGNEQWVSYSALLVAAFSGIRLAKFNLDDQQSDKFIGLPTPANAILLTTFAQLPIHLIPSEGLILATSIISAILLIAPVEMLALKFKNFDFKTNVFRYLLMIMAVALVVLTGWLALPLLIPVYIFLSFTAFLAKKSAQG
jgi:CDP-diacylglycerol--serine O-phosphatidyltransferase